MEKRHEEAKLLLQLIEINVEFLGLYLCEITNCGMREKQYMTAFFQ